MLIQSRLWHAGIMPLEDNKPRVGFTPTRLLKAAGTRPEPAVSEPRLKAANPSATETAEPALDPPLMYFLSKAFTPGP